MSKYYSPTEAEIEQIEQASLRAAWDCLQQFHALDKDDYAYTSSGLKIIFEAYKAARKAGISAAAALAEINGAELAGFYGDITHIVCTAMAFIDVGIGDRTHPLSIAGHRIILMCKATKALDALATLTSALDDDNDLYGEYLADDALSKLVNGS